MKNPYEQEFILQAIETKWFEPTNANQAKIKVSCAARTIYVWYKFELSLENNHRKAAEELCNQLGWDNYLLGGRLKNGNYVWVMIRKDMP